VQGTTYSATGLTAATAYVYKVRALDLAGNPSAFTTDLTVTTGALPAIAVPVVTMTSAELNAIPGLTRLSHLPVEYKQDGVIATGFLNLVEGENANPILHVCSAGNSCADFTVQKTITLDTIGPVMSLAGDLPATITIPSVPVTYLVDGDVQMMVLPLSEGDNTDLKVTAMDAAGNETVLHLPNVRYEKPPAIVAPQGWAGSASAEEDKSKASRATTMSVSDFRIYFQTLNLSTVQRARVNQSLEQIPTGAFVYRYETASGPSFAWMEPGGRSRVFSFENNILLFGDLLLPVLS